jgi:hypothetical protein
MKNLLTLKKLKIRFFAPLRMTMFKTDYLQKTEFLEVTLSRIPFLQVYRTEIVVTTLLIVKYLNVVINIRLCFLTSTMDFYMN